MTKRVPSWIPTAIKFDILVKNMLSQFDWVKTAWTLKLFIQKESKSIFADRCMV